MNRYINNFKFGDNTFYYCDLKRIFNDYPALEKLPNCLKILLEVNLRTCEENNINKVIDIFISKIKNKKIVFEPTRIIMQDLSAIPILIDLATMRDQAENFGVDLKKVNPQIMVDLVVDHSLNIEKTSSFDSVEINLENEIKRNSERYKFIKWASSQFENLSVVPPGFGISHQVNLEYLSTMINIKEIEDKFFIFPECIVGTDLHTSMVNALGILAWEVGEMESQSIMFGLNSPFYLPKVTGIKIEGKLQSGITINDVVLSLTKFINEQETHQEFVEFFGEGVKELSLEDRAAISNMANEYNVAVSFFGVDDNTIAYIEKTRGVDASFIKEYFKLQDMYNKYEDFDFDEVLEFDLSQVKSVVAGPSRSEEKVLVNKVPSKLKSFKRGNLLKANDIVLASITSCLSTSNPSLIIQAGLLIKNAIEFGLEINPNIKKIFTPGSHSVTSYLKHLDLLKFFEYVGFNISGYGCVSCIGNSGKLLPGIEEEIVNYDLDVSSVSSGNRNFKENSNPLIKSNWLMSPALVIAYCFKGTINCNIIDDEIAKGVYLKDIWPSNKELNEYLKKIQSDIYLKSYNNLFLGNIYWQSLDIATTAKYEWDDDSTYIHSSLSFKNLDLEKIEIKNARVLAVLGDNILNEDISAIGKIKEDSLAGQYLLSKNIKSNELDTFENRKGNIDLMIRGILSSPNLENLLISPKKGSLTRDFQTKEIVGIFEYCEKMKKMNIPLVLFAGENFGGGVVRDWASRGLSLLGVKAIIAKSFDHSFKTNLVRVGVLPLEFDKEGLENIELTGDELISIKRRNLIPNEKIELNILKKGLNKTLVLRSKLENLQEVEFYRNGGVLSYILKHL
ncbi:aconitate hydratase A [Malaciobacter pacificus]|uniref:Aconitate hydratase 1 n=1 Tax=Malaciobacter pacificus TaxID=1080223 RepID=A0A5C2H7N9_9BACT|nr:aconitate hydratase AcnA [Malaciobacter pacificus]QEP34349.1 aconitate hydratase 1 [Malaciobacter pacificus]GGD38230.1 aconitate hydratase A [Malaciobacter pacificus]